MPYKEFKHSEFLILVKKSSLQQILDKISGIVVVSKFGIARNFLKSSHFHLKKSTRVLKTFLEEINLCQNHIFNFTYKQSRILFHDIFGFKSVLALGSFIGPASTRSYKIGVVGNNWLVGNEFFSETALRIFLIFCIKLGDYKGRKVTEPDF